jgi:hypothetical protein
MLCIAALTTVFETQARRESTPIENDLKLALKPGYQVTLFATVDQVKVVTDAELSRCICQGYCIWKNFGTYSNWARECVEGTNVFYVEGVGTQFYCAYCPPAPC